MLRELPYGTIRNFLPSRENKAKYYTRDITTTSQCKISKNKRKIREKNVSKISQLKNKIFILWKYIFL